MQDTAVAGHQGDRAGDLTGSDLPLYKRADALQALR